MDFRFRFNASQWQTACVPSDSLIPADAFIRLLLDPSPTANPQSDLSAFACGYAALREDGVVSLTVLDMDTGKYRGGELADKALELIQQWKPVKFSCENNPGVDWFVDLLVLKAKQAEIALPHIEAFTPRNGKQEKDRRIWRLQQLFDCDPPAIRFHYRAYCARLFEQVERFEIGGDKKGRENGLLDSLALLAGY